MDREDKVLPPIKKDDTNSKIHINQKKDHPGDQDFIRIISRNKCF